MMHHLTLPSKCELIALSPSVSSVYAHKGGLSECKNSLGANRVGHPKVVELCLYDCLQIRREQLGLIGPTSFYCACVMGLVVALLSHSHSHSHSNYPRQ